MNEVLAAVTQLNNLVALDLKGNQQSKLMVATAKLFNLTELSLSLNQLSELLPEIAQLQNLRSLYLSNNPPNEVPVEIAQLKELTGLYLSNNQLRELPAAITQLQSLVWLDLSYNQLRDLPTSIAQLQNLTSLDLRNNQLRDLPDFIRDLPNLRKLDLRGNPIAIPPEILGGKDFWESPGDAQTILDFYFNRQRDPKPLYEAKLLIIGEREAGKTSLAKKLKSETCELESQENFTDGIDVLPWKVNHLDGTPMRINIWDFGVQEIDYATHQFFLAKRSLYLLIADDRKEHTDLHYWLKVAETFGENSPLLIIKNEKCGDLFNFDERALRGQFTNLKDSFRTNLNTNRGLDAIRSAIQNYLSGLDHVKQTIPAHWADIRAVIENYSQSCNVLELRDYFDLCRRNGFSTEKDMLAASQFLHDLGICLHFQNIPSLKKTLILRPQWATGTLYKILTNKAVQANFGRFSYDTLEQLWDEGDESDMRYELLQLMEEFALCYEIPGCKGRYIAPQLLKSESPDYDWDSTDNLILSYRYQFKPKAIFPQLIVALHEQIEQNCRVWKHGLVITNGPARAEIIEDDHYRKANITIRVSGSNKRQLLTIVGHEIDKINRSYERLTYEVLIPCNCVKCKGSQDPETYPYETLQEFIRDRGELIQCRKSRKMVNIHHLIDDIAELPARSDLDEIYGLGRTNQSLLDLLRSPFSVIVFGDYNYHSNCHLDQSRAVTKKINQYNSGGDNVAGDKNVNNFHAPQSPEAAQQVIQELLKQLKISEQTTAAKLQNQVMIQDLTWQQTLWAALKNAGPELAKSAVSLALAGAGLPGAVAAAAFNVIIEGVRGGLDARDALPPGDENPFGEPGF